MLSSDTESSSARMGVEIFLSAILIGSANLRFDESPSYSIKYCAEGEDEPPAYARTYYVRVDPSGTLQLGELRAEDISNIGSNNHFLVGLPDAKKLSLAGGLGALWGFSISVRAATASFYSTFRLNMLRVSLKSVSRSLIRKGPPETAVKILAIRPVLGLATVCDGDKMDQVPRMLRTSTGSREVNFYKQIPIFQSSISEAGSARYISFLIPAQTQQMIRFAVRKVFTECEVNTLKGVTDYRRRSSWEVYSVWAQASHPEVIAVPARVLKGPQIRYKSFHEN
ncbi:uncharacterized protein PADG_11069 [Paracoccidioides brasiliensis Pb18]|uniref:Uncharacterized protein n=1 Tax=Paracoccidioides brasiliensis (strain Pb18) TaxID=502780 RepID=A0A0A0HTV1_PARBD|nr:uncharacterized protein PADG_11069 [Paracoccidioides brasiliensis Pb18]KGM92619.1 hypothetical protein PADG_11069 [Paracoccidioides brasiliensis Pb18]